MRITCNKFFAILSPLAHLMANLVSKNGRFEAVIRMIVLKVQEDCPCVT